jgi:predicted ATPase/class 3 adenylate cyclase
MYRFGWQASLMQRRYLMADNAPSGTVTFLFTDIEGSTKLAQEHSAEWESLRARHDALLRSAMETHNGTVFQLVGDAFCAAFHTIREAIDAALDGQRKLQTQPWDDTPIKVRMGIHTGEAWASDGDYRGYLTLTHVQRVMSIAHGGQILLSNSSAGLAHGQLPDSVSLKDMGEHRLKHLPDAEHVWQVLAPDLHQDFPPLERIAEHRNNLPVQLSSFVGRETEISEVRSLLETQRLVTLTGSGGTGKTRLSLEVAAELLDRFKDGVWFIELAPLFDPALVSNTVAAVLGVQEEQGRPLLDTLLDWMRTRDLLLILDNCEHLIEACARFTDALLHGGPGTRILASSREALGIAGETAYSVPSLESPEPAQASQIPFEQLTRYAAMRLFTERAREALTTFSLTKANAPEIAQICHRLDGIPLAIELAAARVKALRVEQIAERLNDRFRLLTSGGRTALPRHQTLRALIDWSHDLLTAPEQILLRRLSAFVGGWTLEAAEQVCAGNGLESDEILDLLTHLVDKSLVGMDEAAQEPRYRMLETIREYALEKLSESAEGEQVRHRHLDFVLDLAEEAEPRIFTKEGPTWLDRLDAELDNLRAALEWAESLKDAAAGLRLAGTVYWFWWARGYWHEGQRWQTAALARPGAEVRTKWRAKALTGMGYFRIMAGQNAEARALLEESASISSEIGDRRGRAVTLAWLGWAIGFAGDYRTSRTVLEEGLALSREFDHKIGIGLSLAVLGTNSRAEGNYEEAQRRLTEAAAVLRETGDKNFVSFAVRRLGYVALHRADFGKAVDLCFESLTVNAELGDQRGVAASLVAIACIASAHGNARRAARLYGASAAVMESLGPLFPEDELEHKPYLLAAISRMGQEEYSSAFAEGRAMKMEQAIAYALEQPRA